MTETHHRAVPARQKFVQTEREAHLAWAKLAAREPMAAAVLHQLVALMDRQGAVAIAHTTLAKLIGIHTTSVKKGLAVLRDNKWIQQVQMGSRGTVNVYVINSRVAWADYRENLKLAVFNARVVVDADDQKPETLSSDDLKRVPVIHPPETPIPTGEWPPGSQPTFDGMEPSLQGMPIEEDDDEEFA